MPLQSIVIKANYCCRSTEALNCFRWHCMFDMSKQQWRCIRLRVYNIKRKLRFRKEEKNLILFLKLNNGRQCNADIKCKVKQGCEAAIWKEIWTINITASRVKFVWRHPSKPNMFNWSQHEKWTCVYAETFHSLSLLGKVSYKSEAVRKLRFFVRKKAFAQQNNISVFVRTLAHSNDKYSKCRFVCLVDWF